MSQLLFFGVEELESLLDVAGLLLLLDSAEEGALAVLEQSALLVPGLGLRDSSVEVFQFVLRGRGEL